MSVVIKGFNKPKNCYSCRFNANNTWCSITSGVIDRDDYTCDVLCPITQLPKGHGDLKDADELTANILCKTFGLRTIDIENAQTIIKADKESGVEE